MNIHINRSAIIRFLSIAAILLIILSITGQLIYHFTGWDSLEKIILLVNLDYEYNIPVAFTVFLMVVIVAILIIITLINAKQNDRYTKYWAVLAVGFIFMAYDEAFVMHERLGNPIRELMGSEYPGILHFAWVIPGMVIVLFLLLFFLKFLRSLPGKNSMQFVLAASIYLSGAIGMELIGGRHSTLAGQENITYYIITTIEESFEMAGLIVFISALMSYFSYRYKEVRFIFEPAESKKEKSEG